MPRRLPKRPGRQPVGEQAASETIRFRAQPAEAEQWRECAQERGETLSDGIREALRERYCSDAAKPPSR